MYLKSIKVLEKVQMQRSIVNLLYSVDFRVASHADALTGLCHAFLFLKEALTTSALETNSRSAINPDSGFRDIFTPWNRESYALESRIQLKNWNPTNDWNPEPGIWNPWYGIQNPRLSSWIPLHGAIQGSRAQ